MAGESGAGPLSPEAADRLTGEVGLRPAPTGGDVTRAAKRAELARQAAVWQQVEAEHEDTVVPDPALQQPVGEPTQYPEGAVAVSGGPAVDDAYERALEALTAAGSPVTGDAALQPDPLGAAAWVVGERTKGKLRPGAGSGSRQPSPQPKPKAAARPNRKPRPQPARKPTGRPAPKRPTSSGRPAAGKPAAPAQKMPRDGDGDGIYNEADIARDNLAAEVQANKRAQELYRETMLTRNTAKRAQFIADLDDDDLKRLTAIVYSEKTSDRDVVKARNAVAAEMAKRGYAIREYGAKGGGLARSTNPKAKVNGATESWQVDTESDRPRPGGTESGQPRRSGVVLDDTVSKEQVEELLRLGWKGDPNDSREILYPPAGIDPPPPGHLTRDGRLLKEHMPRKSREGGKFVAYPTPNSILYADGWTYSKDGWVRGAAPFPGAPTGELALQPDPLGVAAWVVGKPTTAPKKQAPASRGSRPAPAPRVSRPASAGAPEKQAPPAGQELPRDGDGDGILNEPGWDMTSPGKAGVTKHGADHTGWYYLPDGGVGQKRADGGYGELTESDLPESSPTGGKLLQFDGGSARYSDGSTYDADGWTTARGLPGGATRKQPTQEPGQVTNRDTNGRFNPGGGQPTHKKPRRITRGRTASLDSTTTDSPTTQESTVSDSSLVNRRDTQWLTTAAGRRKVPGSGGVGNRFQKGRDADGDGIFNEAGWDMNATGGPRDADGDGKTGEPGWGEDGGLTYDSIRASRTGGTVVHTTGPNGITGKVVSKGRADGKPWIGVDAGPVEGLVTLWPEGSPNGTTDKVFPGTQTAASKAAVDGQGAGNEAATSAPGSGPARGTAPAGDNVLSDSGKPIGEATDDELVEEAMGRMGRFNMLMPASPTRNEFLDLADELDKRGKGDVADELRSQVARVDIDRIVTSEDMQPEEKQAALAGFTPEQLEAGANFWMEGDAEDFNGGRDALAQALRDNDRAGVADQVDGLAGSGQPEADGGEDDGEATEVDDVEVSSDVEGRVSGNGDRDIVAEAEDWLAGDVDYGDETTRTEAEQLIAELESAGLDPEARALQSKLDEHDAAARPDATPDGDGGTATFPSGAPIADLGRDERADEVAGMLGRWNDYSNAAHRAEYERTADALEQAGEPELAQQIRDQIAEFDGDRALAQQAQDWINGDVDFTDPTTRAEADELLAKLDERALEDDAQELRDHIEARESAGAPVQGDAEGDAAAPAVAGEFGGPGVTEADNDGAGYMAGPGLTARDRELQQLMGEADSAGYDAEMTGDLDERDRQYALRDQYSDELDASPTQRWNWRTPGQVRMDPAEVEEQLLDNWVLVDGQAKQVTGVSLGADGNWDLTFADGSSTRLAKYSTLDLTYEGYRAPGADQGSGDQAGDPFGGLTPTEVDRTIARLHDTSPMEWTPEQIEQARQVPGWVESGQLDDRQVSLSGAIAQKLESREFYDSMFAPEQSGEQGGEQGGGDPFGGLTADEVDRRIARLHDTSPMEWTPEQIEQARQVPGWVESGQLDDRQVSLAGAIAQKLENRRFYDSMFAPEASGDEAAFGPEGGATGGFGDRGPEQVDRTISRLHDRSALEWTPEEVADAERLAQWVAAGNGDDRQRSLAGTVAQKLETRRFYDSAFAPALAGNVDEAPRAPGRSVEERAAAGDMGFDEVEDLLGRFEQARSYDLTERTQRAVAEDLLGSFTEDETGFEDEVADLRSRLGATGGEAQTRGEMESELDSILSEGEGPVGSDGEFGDDMTGLDEARDGGGADGGGDDAPTISSERTADGEAALSESRALPQVNWAVRDSGRIDRLAAPRRELVDRLIAGGFPDEAEALHNETQLLTDYANAQWARRMFGPAKKPADVEALRDQIARLEEGGMPELAADLRKWLPDDGGDGGAGGTPTGGTPTGGGGGLTAAAYRERVRARRLQTASLRRQARAVLANNVDDPDALTKAAQYWLSGDVDFADQAVLTDAMALVAKLEAAGLTEVAEELRAAAGQPTGLVASADVLPAGPRRWEGVLAPIGANSGDRRRFKTGGTFRVRPLPLPLMFQEATADGHDTATVVGRILTVEVRDDHFWGTGDYLEDEAFAAVVGKAIALNKAGMGHVSVDLADLVVEGVDANGNPIAEPVLLTAMAAGTDAGVHDQYAEATIIGATQVAKPAFGEALLQMVEVPVVEEVPFLELLIGGADTAGVAQRCSLGDTVTVELEGQPGREVEGVVVEVDGLTGTVTIELTEDRDERVVVPAAQVRKVQPLEVRPLTLAVSAREQVLSLQAAAGQFDDWRPDPELFADPKLQGLTPMTVGPVLGDGSRRVFGHIAGWDTCHVGFTNRCVTPPRESNYDYFHIGEVDLSDGSALAIGNLTLGGRHADVTMAYRDAVAHYDDQGAGVGMVRAYPDEFGIAFSGVIPPEVTNKQIRDLKRCGLSGDWRRIGTKMRMSGALAVNSGGYPVPRYSVDGKGRQNALVAAGMVPQSIVPVENYDEIAARVFAGEQQREARREEIRALSMELAVPAYRDELAALMAEVA